MMSIDVPFAIVKVPHRPRRPLGNLLQEIASRAPEKISAFEELAIFTLSTLDAQARQKQEA